MSTLVRCSWVAAYAVTTFLAFPQQLGDQVLDLGLVAAWLAPAALLLALRGLAPVRAAWVGFIAGLVAHSAVLHWIYVVTVVHGNAPVLAGLAAPVGLAAYIACFTALFSVVYAWLARAGAGGPLAAALLWTVLDHLRSFALSGFPWATLGYAQHENLALLGLVPWTGVYGLSFVTVLAGAGLAELIQARAATLPGVRAILGALALHGLGLIAPAPDGETDETLRVAVLQGNLAQAVKWDSDWADRALSIYEDLTREAAHAGAQLVLWPETAAPGLPSIDPVLRERLARLAQETRVMLVIGSVGIEGEVPDWHYYDSAFVIEPSGQFVDRYDKSHLVPFGEYVPLRNLLGGFLSAVASGIATADVSPGEGPRALRLASSGGSGLTVGVPICYELLFPDLVRRFVADGARLLLAITNDAWYGRTGAPYQFLAITALRSAETGVWTARAANTGISAFIDHRGRVQQQTSIFERGILVGDLPLVNDPETRTFYVRHGDVFAWACWIGVGIFALAARRRAPIRRG